MRAPLPRMRLGTLLILVAVVAFPIAWGVTPRRVGRIYDATSMPGCPVSVIPMDQKGWLVRWAERLIPRSSPSPSPFTSPA